mmetsp:Transcript_108017/g.191253  ORF Transcript_108017/g.191253 Transcript_108017/m.191253 type:complete len:101 (-) Transcript_108017:170-472(-)
MLSTERERAELQDREEVARCIHQIQNQLPFCSMSFSVDCNCLSQIQNCLAFQQFPAVEEAHQILWTHRIPLNCQILMSSCFQNRQTLYVWKVRFVQSQPF